MTLNDTFKTYLDKRILWVFLMGCASGFPWVLIGSAMSGWLKDAGLTRTAIGLFGSIFAVYAINFLWAPLIDRVRIPILGSWGNEGVDTRHTTDHADSNRLYRDCRSS